MVTRDHELRRGLAALRLALWYALQPDGLPAGTTLAGTGWLYADADAVGVGRPGVGPRGGARSGRTRTSTGIPTGSPPGASAGPLTGSDGATSVADEATRLKALVDLARNGDAEAFGQLFDHYHVSVYRFLYYRVGSVPLAEDLTSETFFRAMRGMASFRWQGKDFGAWLTTIARNLTTDHFKSGRNRLETVTDDMSAHDTCAAGPEETVLAALTNEALLGALRKLPAEQQDCLVMRFLQGLSIAETAAALGRSPGAVKQLQLRGVRNLASLLPAGLQ
jgi:RNA polymerase sigma-70 factor (ECF subfamily)